MTFLLSFTEAATRVSYSRDYGNVPVVGIVDQVNFKNLLIVEPGISIEITEDVTFDEVSAINIKHTTCFYFPRGFTKYFRGIEAINIDKSKLRAITKDDLQPFHLLKVLSLNGNLLTSLDAGLFTHNLDLKFVSLANNRIRSISAELFDGLITAPKIDLSDNVCITSDTFSMSRSEIEDEILKKCQFGRNRLFESQDYMENIKKKAMKEITKSYFEKTWLPALIESGVFCWYWLVSKAIWMASLVITCIVTGFMIAEMMEVAYASYLSVKMHVQRFFMNIVTICATVWKTPRNKFFFRLYERYLSLGCLLAAIFR